jgi:hypothetical protein
MDKCLSREELDKLSTEEICTLANCKPSFEMQSDLLRFTAIGQYAEVVMVSPTKCKVTFSREMIYNLYNAHYDWLELDKKTKEYWSAPVDKRCWKP